MGHHLCQTFNHRRLDGRTQFPPTIGQPERLAAGNKRGQVEICHSSAQHPIGVASGCVTLKQKLAARRIAAPPVEAPNLLTLMKNGLVLTLWPGQDILGFGAEH